MDDLSDIRLIIVDDEIAIRDSLHSYFEDRGCTVVSADSAEQMLDRLREEIIDCAIIDMRLPGMDGNAVILKAREVLPSLQFLIYTGSTDYQIPSYLSAIGVTDEDVFHKPLIDMSLMVEAVKKKVFEEIT